MVVCLVLSCERGAINLCFLAVFFVFSFFLFFFFFLLSGFLLIVALFVTLCKANLFFSINC